MKRFLTLSLIFAVLSSGAFAATSTKAPVKRSDPMAKTVSTNFVDVPLEDAIKFLAGKAGMSYSIDKSIDRDKLKVTAALKNVSLWQAVYSITRMAGLDFNVKGKALLIVSKNKGAQSLIEQEDARLRRGASESQSPITTRSSTSLEPDDLNQVAVIKLKYISSSDLGQATVILPGMRNWKTYGEHQLIVRGSHSFIEKAKSIAMALDTPDALPKAIHVWLVVTLSSGIQPGFIFPRDYILKTEGVGVEGSVIPIDLDIREGNAIFELRGQVIPRLLTRNFSYKETWPDGKLISLQGQLSSISCQFGSAPPLSFRKGNIAIAASLSNEKMLGGKTGKEIIYKDQATITSGTVDSGAGPVGFKIVMYADVEEGGVITK
ncbi:MAG: hypothetical protein Q7N50_05675 [Armatimonadota bacterium]|nr:hypothetical protein [Armatimonadota bacterium]